MNELDKKLAKWAGFTYDEDGEFVNGMWVDRSKWMSPDRIMFYGEPQFTDSLDLCFQYLVPKCDQVDLAWFRGTCEATAYAFKQQYADEVVDSSPALALCKAIEKLIDGEVE